MTFPRETRRRRARSALLLGLAAFVAVQLALAVAIETCWPIFRDPDYVQKATRLHHRLAVSPMPDAVVMFGSSRTVFALDGTPVEAELEKKRGRPAVVFNFGLWGAGPANYLLCLDRLLAEGTRPDVVLIEVLPTFLTCGAGPRRDLGRLTADRLSRQELEALERLGYPMTERCRDWWLGWPVPCYAHRLSLLNATLPFFLPPHLRATWSSNPDRSCFVPLPWYTGPVWQEAYIRKAYGEYAHLLCDFHLGGACPNALRRLLATCHQEGIVAALVLMPEGSLFRSWYAADTLRQVHAFLADLGREFHPVLVDAREWIEDEGFSDSHHLRPAGATQFSLRLGREVILPLLQGKPPRAIGHAP